MEGDCEEDESEVGVSNKFPGEAVKEADVIIDEGWGARPRAVRARAVLDVSVAIEDTVRIDVTIARQRGRVEVARCLAFPIRGEVDVGEGVGSAIVAQEVEESD